MSGNGGKSVSESKRRNKVKLFIRDETKEGQFINNPSAN